MEGRARLARPEEEVLALRCEEHQCIPQGLGLLGHRRDLAFAVLHFVSTARAGWHASDSWLSPSLRMGHMLRPGTVRREPGRRRRLDENVHLLADIQGPAVLGEAVDRLQNAGI